MKMDDLSPPNQLTRTLTLQTWWMCIGFVNCHHQWFVLFVLVNCRAWTSFVNLWRWVAIKWRAHSCITVLHYCVFIRRYENVLLKETVNCRWCELRTSFICITHDTTHVGTCLIVVGSGMYILSDIYLFCATTGCCICT